ncbi:uncharacterized protein LOC109713156 isoform X2 [Ananas comosus]|uniref:Pollen-specific protein-like n=2 Tax=Ananas comosus TaxID=4615 RepID=A0A199VGX2_ANACO|nr:uncharacterized protein LOC109713156 isoform X2 [Ananas comosus]OAY76258.1 Pollen-specific protein-like [Ananas comosus]
MDSTTLIVAFLSLCTTNFFSAEALPRPISNITVLGSVYCDPCSNNTFSKHSFFLKGARVQIQCRFRVNSTSREEILIEAERTTDKFGIYKLDIPPVDGFECREGREIRSACRANLISSSSSSCNVPGLQGSTQHLAIKPKQANICFFNLNALNYRPPRRNTILCGTHNTINSSLLFWPFLPPFWPLPFSIPQWLTPFLKLSSFPSPPSKS